MSNSESDNHFQHNVNVDSGLKALGVPRLVRAPDSVDDSIGLSVTGDPVRFLFTDQCVRYKELLSELNFPESLERFFLNGTQISSISSLAVGAEMVLVISPRYFYFKLLAAIWAVYRFWNRKVPVLFSN